MEENNDVIKLPQPPTKATDDFDYLSSRPTLELMFILVLQL